MVIPPSVNYFVWKRCNMQCRFCYATFRDVPHQLEFHESQQLIRRLAEAGVEKISFVGGEPTLHPHIVPLLKLAHDVGMVTVLISNGARLREVVRACTPGVLNWVGLDIDSSSEDVEIALGRGTGGHIDNMIEMADLCHERGIRLKLNTVVTSLSWQDYMGDIVERVKPDRWKAFQVLPVQGQNDGKVDDLLITSEQFGAWVARHRHLGVIAETNDLMSCSYALIDPSGRFYSGHTTGHQYGKPILDVGVEEAWASVEFNEGRFHARGGLYNWAPESM